MSRVRNGFVRFRFQTGSIKSVFVVHSAASFHGFDSKLVRLKVLKRIVKSFEVVKFRFQTGSIKSHGHHIKGDTGHPGFDSKLVRLKGRGGIFRLSENHVSIPNWFD